jgi:hypothetical protein
LSELSQKYLAIKNVLPKTCREARSENPFLNSGMYWIDPDGPGVGNASIYVFCNMTSGIMKHLTTQLS